MANKCCICGVELDANLRTGYAEKGAVTWYCEEHFWEKLNEVNAAKKKVTQSTKSNSTLIEVDFN